VAPGQHVAPREPAEGVLLTVLLLLGVHVALRLMFAVGAPAAKVADASPQIVGSERSDR
jgi:hypothetical protein